MITLNNNNIIVSKDEKCYEYLRRFLIKINLVKNINYFTYNATRSVTKYNILEVDKLIDSMNDQLRARRFDKCNSFYEPYYIYNLDNEDNLIIPIGLLQFIKPFINGESLKINYDLSKRLINTNKVISKLNNKILPGITLREEQMKAIKLCLTLKRTIIQMGTRFWKIRSNVRIYKSNTKRN